MIGDLLSLQSSDENSKKNLWKPENKCVCFSLAIEGKYTQTFASVHNHPISTENVQTLVLCEYKLY